MSINSNYRLIAELGSNHRNDLGRLKAAIDMVEGTGIELKAQLFKQESPCNSGGNIYLAPKTFEKALDYATEKGVTFSSSVFDYESFNFLINLAPKFIKFAYSMKELDWMIKETLSEEIEAIVSCDHLSRSVVPDGCTKLLCIPQYPVYSELSFDECFPPFDGFSDHTLGFKQSKRAVAQGARILEKHVKLDASDNFCPDDRFSVPLRELIKVNFS